MLVIKMQIRGILVIFFKNHGISVISRLVIYESSLLSSSQRDNLIGYDNYPFHKLGPIILWYSYKYQLCCGDSTLVLKAVLCERPSQVLTTHDALMSELA